MLSKRDRRRFINQLVHADATAASQAAQSGAPKLGDSDSQPAHWIELKRTTKLQVRFYIDPGTDAPHIHNHQVNEEEVIDVLEEPGEDRPSKEGARVALGRRAAEGICA